MAFLRRYIYLLSFLGVLVFSSIMVLRQINLNREQHVNLREAMVMLQTRGYTNEANHLYRKLLGNVFKLSNRQLMDDFQRTLIVIDPGVRNPDNPIWCYHWYISNELEKRSESTLKQALKLAEMP
jgi:hypothetical protein